MQTTSHTLTGNDYRKLLNKRNVNYMSILMRICLNYHIYVPSLKILIIKSDIMSMHRSNRGMNLTQQVADTLGNAIINGKRSRFV